MKEPTHIILTEEGVSYFVRRNRRLQRFRLLNGEEDYGLLLSQYAPSSMDKLISNGLVHKMQFPVADAVQYREMVLQHVTLTVQGGVSVYASHAMSTILEASDVSIQWKRKHPRSTLSTGRDGSKVARFLDAKSSEHRAQRDRFVADTVALYQKVRGRAIDDGGRKMIQERCLPAIPSGAWFLLLAEPNDESSASLWESLVGEAVHLVQLHELADYVALVWVELLAGMQQKERQTDSDQIPTAYLLTQMGFRGSSRSGGPAGRYRIHMIASTDSIRFDALRTDFDQLLDHSAGSEERFAGFYRSATRGDGDLGHYYAGFLEEMCGKLNVGFESYGHGEGENARLNMILTL